MAVDVIAARREAHPGRGSAHQSHWISGEPGGASAGSRAFVLTNVSWSASETVSFEQWVLNGRRLGAIGRGVGWWIGDWLRFGNARYGERYVQAAKITGYDKQTLMNMVYVASRVEPPRRREKLSWSHHAEVAASSPEQQDVWLDKAECSRLSVQDLRQLLGKARKREKDVEAGRPAGPDPTVCPHCGHEFEARGGQAKGRPWSR